MKKKQNRHDQDEPLGKLTRIKDFLPPPDELFPEKELAKITIALDQETISFFKQKASKFGLKYQRMIREVLKGYAKRYR
ncbi:MAG: CopG family transcriptional regulator [Bacteriovoracaceae bacterium]|nr:CopG family transcriptional regulator [Bacteriovoracaceae bacterium]